MNKSNSTVGVVAMLAVAGGLSAAHAAPTFVGSDVGSWTKLQGAGPGAVYSITNNDAGPSPNSTASFDFGTPGGPGDKSNLFTFNGTGSNGSGGFGTTAETPFDIGQFSYRNGTTTASSFPSTGASIDLSIALTLTSPTGLSSNFAYDFSIDLTPNNTGDPVKDGDIVSITKGTTSTTFNAGGATYTLALNGFSEDGGKTFITQFNSPEGNTANADIYATITTNVPEPGSLVLLSAALTGLGFLARRHKAV